MIRLTHEAIPTEPLIPAEANLASGATVVFLGTARAVTDGRRTEWLEYEAYPAMAERVLEELSDNARDQWPLLHLEIIHRLGRVPLGQACVAIVIAAPHRREAFQAAEWLMDRIKEQVPIWKKEHWSDGTSEWVHPGTPQDHPTR